MCFGSSRSLSQQGSRSQSVTLAVTSDLVIDASVGSKLVGSESTDDGYKEPWREPDATQPCNPFWYAGTLVMAITESPIENLLVDYTEEELVDDNYAPVTTCCCCCCIFFTQTCENVIDSVEEAGYKGIDVSLSPRETRATKGTNDFIPRH